jgi:hypothetical protein
MDRGELAGFLYAAERVSPMHAALAVLLGLNGLRVSEACGANIEDPGFERGRRTLQIVGKGSKPATVPLVPRTGRCPLVPDPPRDLAQPVAQPVVVPSGGCSSTLGRYSTSWMLPSNVRLSIISNATSG